MLQVLMVSEVKKKMETMIVGVSEVLVVMKELVVMEVVVVMEVLKEIVGSY